MSGVGQYVEDWVRVFYTTFWIAPERNFIQFMFQGESFRLYRNNTLEALGLQASSRWLHEIVHPHAQPLHRPLVGGVFPTDDEIRSIFRPPFAPGSPRVPDMLTPKAKALHMALRRSLLPMIGYGEAITSLQ